MNSNPGDVLSKFELRALLLINADTITEKQRVEESAAKNIEDLPLASN